MFLESLNSASISTMAALCGSLVGAVGSSAGVWLAQRHQGRRDLLTRKIFHREQLYSDFISETAQAFADAVQHTFQDPSRLILSYALLSRMRLSSSKNTVKCAEQVIENILETYAKPNMSAEEFHAWVGERNDPLREFSNICSAELKSLWTGTGEDEE
jgi:hypothetical protein